MKQRKLFAILTLVAFMMTLLPMAAFAAADRFASAPTLTIDTDTVDADGIDEAEISLYLYQTNNAPAVNEAVYVASSRGASDAIEINGSSNFVTSGSGRVYYGTADGNGKVEIKVKSTVPGTAKIGVALAHVNNVDNNIYQYLVGNSNSTQDSVGLVGTKDVKFQTTGAANLNMFAVNARDRQAGAWVPATAVGTTPVETYVNTNWSKANDLDHYRYQVRVTNSANAPVADQTVEFSVNNNNARLSTTSATTNNNGVATVLVYAKRGGDYEVTATVANATEKAKFRFGVGDAIDLKLVSKDGRKIAKNTNANFDFEIFDASGNKLIPPTGSDLGSVNVELVKQPSASNLKDSDFEKRNDGNNDYLRIKLNSGKTFTREGDYTLRVSLDNGRYIDTSFTVKEQGRIERISLNYKTTTVPLDTLSLAPEVKSFDAEDVERTITIAGSGLVFSASDVSKLQMHGTPAAYFQNGVFKTTASDKYLGSVIISVTDTSRNLVATQEIVIADKLASLVAENALVAEVGQTAGVTVNAVDVKGNVVAIGDPAVSFENYTVAQKPDGAIVTVEAESAFAKNLKEKGTAKVNITSDVAGSVSVIAVVKVGGNNFTVPMTVNFGAAKPDVGANKVTLFIGQQVAVVDGDASVLDVAPFIKDGRTFVPVRFIAEALGAEVKYDAATQVVTATRGDDVVVMTIGSNVMTVNGEAQVTDVAPFIVDGRTVLPFRALAEAFGSEVAWDAATQSVVFEK